MTMIRRQPRFADPAIFARLLTAQAGLTVSGGDVTVAKTSPVANLDDTGAASDAATLAYVSLRRAGIEKGWMGFGEGASGRLSIFNGIGDLRFITAGSAAVTVYTNSLLRLAISGTGPADFQGNAVSMGALTATTGVFGTDPGGAQQVRIGGALRINSATLISTATAFTNGAGASAGTLANAPAAGDPTKWIPVDDNGTTRYLPAW